MGRDRVGEETPVDWVGPGVKGYNSADETGRLLLFFLLKKYVFFNYS